MTKISTHVITYIALLVFGFGLTVGIVMLAKEYKTAVDTNDGFVPGICTIISYSVIHTTCNQHCSPHPCSYSCYMGYFTFFAIPTFNTTLSAGIFQTKQEAIEYMNTVYPIDVPFACYYHTLNYTYIMFQLYNTISPLIIGITALIIGALALCLFIMSCYSRGFKRENFDNIEIE